MKHVTHRCGRIFIFGSFQDSVRWRQSWHVLVVVVVPYHDQTRFPPKGSFQVIWWAHCISTTLLSQDPCSPRNSWSVHRVDRCLPLNTGYKDCWDRCSVLHLGTGLGLLEKVWCEGGLVAIYAFCCEAADLMHLLIILSPVSQLCVSDIWSQQ